jgi:hypothetical protein
MRNICLSGMTNGKSLPAILCHPSGVIKHPILHATIITPLRGFYRLVEMKLSLFQDRFLILHIFAQLFILATVKKKPTSLLPYPINSSSFAEHGDQVWRNLHPRAIFLDAGRREFLRAASTTNRFLH